MSLAIKIIQALGRKIAAKKQKTPGGITQIQPQIYAESEAGSIAATLQDAGIPLDRLDDFIKSEADVVRILNQIEALKKRNLADSIRSGIRNTETGKVFDLKGREIKNPKNIMGGEELPPPGSRGGPDDIAAPIQSSDESLRDMMEAEIKKKIEKQNKEAAKKFKDKMKDDPEDMAQGGRVGLMAGSIPKIFKLLKDPKKVKQAIDNIFPTGDVKYDATMAAESLVELNPKIFNNKLYDDLDSITRLDIYDAVISPMMSAQAKALKMKKATKPEKTLQSMKEGKGINMSDPEIAKEFEQFMKQTDPEGVKKLEQILELDNFDLKGRKKNAQGGRAGFKIGGIDKARRAFLKAAAGVTGGIAALKTGLLNIGKGADAVKNLPPIKTPVTKLEGTTTQMPDWFPSFINKFRDEGKAKDVFKTKKVEVSKEEFDQAFKEGKGENYYTDVARTPEYKANNPDHMDYFKLEDTDERIYTTYTNDKVPGVRVDDMDGNVDVMFENDYSQPVSLNYTAPGKRGPETGRADLFVQGGAKIEPKPKGEFVANDVETYATDPDGGYEAVDVIADTVDDMMEGKTRQMQEYVTGKKTKLSRGEGRVIEAEIRAEQASDAAAEAAAEAADEFASGGIARMLGE